MTPDRAKLALTAVAVFALINAPSGPALAVEATVGAYYYPWWSSHNWDATLRAQMAPDDHMPAAGYYGESEATIAEHINQSHRANVSLWASSWWGPGSSTDNALRQQILPHPRAGELDYAIHYESTGRFGETDGVVDYSNLVSDFTYLADNVFSDPSYFRIDDRPVVFMYVTRAYFDDSAAEQALADARQAVFDSHGYDPYVVGDEVFGNSFNASRAANFDAVTTFDVYGMSGLKQSGAFASDVTTAANKYAAAAGAGATLIPAITPGYNDTAVRDGNDPTGRYFDNQTIDDAGSVFTSLIDQAALPHLDDSIGNLMMVNSWNEWHEDTQIEATIDDAATSAVDNSDSGTDFTDGNTYEAYGTKYLDLLRVRTTDAAIPLIDGDADFDGDLDADDIPTFIAAWRAEFLVDGQRTGGVESRESLPDFNYDGVVDFADWFVMRDAHAITASLSELLAVPEPTTLALGWMGLAAAIGSRRRAG